jgi:hypothetical protein
LQKKGRQKIQCDYEDCLAILGGLSQAPGVLGMALRDLRTTPQTMLRFIGEKDWSVLRENANGVVSAIDWLYTGWFSLVAEALDKDGETLRAMILDEAGLDESELPSLRRFAVGVVALANKHRNTRRRKR